MFMRRGRASCLQVQNTPARGTEGSCVRGHLKTVREHYTSDDLELKQIIGVYENYAMSFIVFQAPNNQTT